MASCKRQRRQVDVVPPCRRPSRLALCGCLAPAPGAVIVPRAAVLGAGLRAAPRAAQLGDTALTLVCFSGQKLVSSYAIF